MMTRIREWLEETHCDTFELVRHFLARFFDTETGASPEEWQKLAIGVGATLVSLGLIGFQTYWVRYNWLQNPVVSTAKLYRDAVRGDLILALAIVMAITTALTLIQWRSLFPSLRDYLALDGFPVSARQIFFAKFAALFLLFAGFALALCGPLGVLFGACISGHFRKTLRLD